MIKTLVIKIIEGYQKTLSPDHGFLSRFYPNGYCQYYPSCSQYSKEAFQQHSLVVAFIKSLYRIIRCNPFSKGGIDLVIKQK